MSDRAAYVERCTERRDGRWLVICVDDDGRKLAVTSATPFEAGARVEVTGREATAGQEQPR
jgi:hypothetical protein